MNNHRKDETERIHDEVSFPTSDLLCRVVSSWTTLLRCLHGLAVYYRGAGVRISSSLDAHHIPERVVYVSPGAVVAPQPEVPPHCAVWREIMWKVPSRTSSSQYVQYCIYDLAHVHLAMPSAVLLGWNQWLNDTPLFVREVRRIWLPATTCDHEDRIGR